MKKVTAIQKQSKIRLEASQDSREAEIKKSLFWLRALTRFLTSKARKNQGLNSNTDRSLLDSFRKFYLAATGERKKVIIC